MKLRDIQLNKNKILRISKDTVNGVTFYQLRYWTRDNQENAYKPTEKVIAFHVDKLDEILLSLIHSSVDNQNIIPN